MSKDPNDLKVNKNNYFNVAYQILLYLKDCYEHGKDPDPKILNYENIGISRKQFVLTLQMLLDDRYIKGVNLTHVVQSPTIISNLSNCYVTSSGLQYLADNSMMKRVYRISKEIRDWLPLLK